jgi:uncharacterized RDD family membrane protein YckC
MTNNIFCSQCGTSNNPSSRFCQKCGASIVAAVPAVAPVSGTMMSSSPAAAVMAAAPGQQYAGFWIRFLALVVDHLILNAALLPIASTFGLLHFGTLGRFDHEIDPADIAILFAGLSTLIAILSVASWLYEALLTSSSWQGTVGKKLLGLKVTDDFGNRISFARATGRYFSKILSAMICYIGFIMAAFTDRKKALHDMIAGTVVIKTR